MMSEFANEIKVGTVFTRVDRNGKTWEAVVTKRTPLFVEVDVHKPYPEKVYGGRGDYYYVDHIIEKPTFHRGRIKLYEIIDQVKTGKMETHNYLGMEFKAPEIVEEKKGYCIFLVDRKSKFCEIDEKNTNFRCVSKYEWRF